MMKISNCSGWIFIDKPEGKTSFDIIRQIKKILKIKKIVSAKSYFQNIKKIKSKAI